jgi:hypothetical protein
MPVNKAFVGNWPEDFEHENGNYANQCKECKMLFVGHKRRLVCKLCAAPDFKAGYLVGQKSLSPEVQEVLEKVKEKFFPPHDLLDGYNHCRFCGLTSYQEDKIRHLESCIMPIIEKLLAKE